jgi:O-antigen/teichoic acid export membrane protein
MNLNNSRNLIKKLNSYAKGTLAEAISTLTSRESLKAHLRMPLYTNAYYLIANMTASAVFGFVFWVIAARLYEPAEVGLASAAITAINLLAYLSSLGLGVGLIRFLPDSNNKVKMINSSFTLSGLVALFVALVFLVSLPLWSPALLSIRQHPIFLSSFVLFTVVMTITSLTEYIFIAERHARFAFFMGVIAAVAKIGFVIALAAFFGTFAIFASVGLALSLGLAVAALVFLPRAEPGYMPVLAVRGGALTGMLSYSFGNYAATMLWIVPGMVFPLMVVNILGAEMNAYFYIAWAIAGLLFAIPYGVSLSLFAEGSYNEDQFLSNIRRSLKLCLLLTVPAVALIIILGGRLLLIFGKPYSENAAMCLSVLALSTFPLIINHIFLTTMRVQKDIKGIISLSAAIACLTLGLSYFLIGRIGILGVGIGWTVGQAIVAAAVLLVLFVKPHSLLRDLIKKHPE